MNMRQFVSLERSDESIYIFARPYFLSFLPWFVLGLGLLVVGVIFTLFVSFSFSEILSVPLNHNIFVVMVSAYFLLLIPFMTVGFIDYYYDLLVVTDRRLLDINQNSLFSRDISELALEQIEDVSSENEGILSTFFDFGNVVVQSAAAKEKFIFNGILHPREVSEIILDLADQAKQRIERGPDRLIPQGHVKAVINNEIYTNLADLYKIGAVVRPGSTSSEIVPTEGVAAPKVASSPPPDPSDDLDIVIDDPKKK